MSSPKVRMIQPDDVFESNRRAWNQAMEYHQKARNGALQDGFAQPSFTIFNREGDDILLSKLATIDLEGKTIAQLPCNNGRELLSLLKLGAARAMGFDISDKAIAEAKQLAQISQLPAEFERVNILEIGHQYDEVFDFIYISEGSLQWFADLDAYFSVVLRLLNNGGKILIFEIHPLAYLFEEGVNRCDISAGVSYFKHGPYNYSQGLDYVGGVSYNSENCYWFMHKMSDIINSLGRVGVKILEFEEYNLEIANNPTAANYDCFPLSYSIIAENK